MELQLFETFDSDVFVVDDALGVMRLECEGSFVQLAGIIFARFGVAWLDVFHDDFIIHFHGHLVAFDGDGLGPPFVILGGRFFHVVNVVKAAGFFPVAVRIWCGNKYHHWTSAQF